MDLSRRDFLRASSAIAAAFGLRTFPGEAVAQTPGSGAPTVVWLQAQSCSGCSVSLLNSIYYLSAAELLTKTLTVAYHPTVMATAGADAVAVAQQALGTKGYILVVEGSIPVGAQGRYCYLWPGMTAVKGVQTFAPNAAYILAVGTCSSYGGMPAGRPNPTGVTSLGAAVGVTRVVNLPGCPAHPDWVVGTIAYILKEKKAPELDRLRRPKTFYPEIIHEECPFEDDYEHGRETGNYGRCRYGIGCKGPKAVCDCYRRKWNSGAAKTPGVNWCMASGCPCLGCTEPGFPDSMSPFYLSLSGTRTSSGTSASGGGGTPDDEHDRSRSTSAAQTRPQSTGAQRRPAGQPTRRGPNAPGSRR
jgi:hydrogenase small subunit